MKTTALILVLTAIVYAWTYPDCEHDSCYRNLVDPRYTGQAPIFCIGWISGTTTDAVAVPTQYRNCLGVAPLSSACSCIAYTATKTDRSSKTETSITSSATTSAPSSIISSDDTTECTTETKTSATSPVTTSTVSVSTFAYTVSSTKAATTQIESSSVSTQSRTVTTTPRITSTIFTASTHTVTKCPAQVTNCPVQSTVVLIDKIPVSTIIYLESSTDLSALTPQSSTRTPQLRSFSEISPYIQSSAAVLPPQSSIHAPRPSPQSPDCFAGKEIGPNGDCTLVASSFSQHSDPPTATTQLLATTASTHAPTALDSSNSNVTAGVSRIGIDTAVVVVVVAAAALI